MGSELTGKFLQNDFFLLQTYFFDFKIEFLIKFWSRSTLDRPKSSMERPKQPQFHFLLDFSRIFSLQISLRYSQSLYQAHIHHSRLSSITIGPLYLQNTPYFNHLNHGIHKTPAHQGNFCRTVFV